VFDLPPDEGRRVLSLIGEQDMIEAPSSSAPAAAKERSNPAIESPASQELTPLEASYALLLKTRDAVYAHEAKPAAVEKTYMSRFAPSLARDRLQALDPRDLAALYGATSSLADLFPDARHLARMRTVYDELARRDKATDGQARTMLGALFHARDFKGLAAFRASTPKAPGIAAITLDGPAGPWGKHEKLVVDTATQVRPEMVDLAHGAHVVVVASPGCHFSRHAVEAIEGDPTLSGILSGHSTWLEPAEPVTDLKPWLDWDASHPAFRIDLAASDTSWPEVAIWRTPTFLFFRDGKVVATVVGWPKEGNGAAIKEAWAKATRPSSRK
jgi:hypothetical protein